MASHSFTKEMEKYWDQQFLLYLPTHGEEEASKLAWAAVDTAISKRKRFYKYVQSKWDSEKDTYKGMYFLTIRPHADFKDFEQFYKFTHTLFKKKCMTLQKLVFEQKGTEESTMGTGFHFHAIIKVSSPSKGKKYYLNEIFTLVSKSKLSDHIAQNCIQLNQITNESYMQNINNYINTAEFGKEDENKFTSWELDTKWRHSKNLQDTYTNIPEFRGALRLQVQDEAN